MLRVMGVDPHGAKPFAFTVLEGREVVTQGKGDVRSLDMCMEVFKPDLVAVEDQYMAKNYKVAKMLSQSAGKALGVAELRGVKAVTVNVATWKARFKVLKGHGAHVPVSVALGGLEDDDLASSHLIALHAFEEAARGDVS